MPFTQDDVRRWLGWTNLKNQAPTFSGTLPRADRLGHLSYQDEEDQIMVLKTQVDAYIGSDGRIQSLYGWYKHPLGRIVPLSSNVALTTLANELLKGECYKVRPREGKDYYLWFPEGIEAAKDGPYLTRYPDQHLLHVHWKDYQLYLFKARVPSSPALETFYPETHTAYAFREHPECWMGYWNHGGDCLVNLSNNCHLHVWTNAMEMPQPEKLVEFLAKRLTRTVGGNHKSLFTLRALEAVCTS